MATMFCSIFLYVSFCSLLFDNNCDHYAINFRFFSGYCYFISCSYFIVWSLCLFVFFGVFVFFIVVAVVVVVVAVVLLSLSMS